MEFVGVFTISNTLGLEVFRDKENNRWGVKPNGKGKIEEVEDWYNWNTNEEFLKWGEMDIPLSQVMRI